MVTRSLLLESADCIILIDTGNGDKWSQKMKDIYRIQTPAGGLPEALARKGLTVTDITDVICTHLHFDHAGGNTRMDHDELVPAFPRATYWVQETNLALANHPHEKDRASYLPENWSVLAENGMLQQVHGDEELFSGIRLEVVHGHTRGQQLPLISDTKTTLLFGGDLFPTKAHIPIPWIMAYDNEPLLSIQEKHRLLPQLLERDALIFFEHDPLTSACRLETGRHGIIGGSAVAV
jgi:glyoxylase-like metal-dependent hydrolase (beta-lactamase superfamily II)